MCTSHQQICQEYFIVKYCIVEKDSTHLCILSSHYNVGTTLCWKAFLENTTPHQHHWEDSIHQSPRNHLLMIGGQLPNQWWCRTPPSLWWKYWGKVVQGWIHVVRVEDLIRLATMMRTGILWRRLQAQWQSNTILLVNSIQRWGLHFIWIHLIRVRQIVFSHCTLYGTGLHFTPVRWAFAALIVAAETTKSLV